MKARLALGKGISSDALLAVYGKDYLNSRPPNNLQIIIAKVNTHS
jgi:hypothetical protein